MAYEICEYLEFQRDQESKFFYSNNDCGLILCATVVCGSDGLPLKPDEIGGAYVRFSVDSDEEVFAIFRFQDEKTKKQGLEVKSFKAGRFSSPIWAVELKKDDNLEFILRFMPRQLRRLIPAIKACVKKFEYEIDEPVFIAGE